LAVLVWSHSAVISSQDKASRGGAMALRFCTTWQYWSEVIAREWKFWEL
jgi:hypothetical protein